MNTHQAYGEGKMAEVHRYLGLVLSEGLPDLSTERDGLNYIISEIVVDDKLLDVKLLDGTSILLELHDYRPRRGSK